MTKGMPKKIKGILIMSAKKKPFQVQHTVLTIKNDAPIAHDPGTRDQSDSVPESL